ncbi:MAG TPA: HYR domain-containing protein [Bacteroidetes bacterium]|nr:HYR domain-containing protein [Bacteroidota bacterium]
MNTYFTPVFKLLHCWFCAFATTSPQPQKGRTCSQCTKPAVLWYKGNWFFCFAFAMFFVPNFAFGNPPNLEFTCPDTLVIQLEPGECGTEVFYDTLTWSNTDILLDTLFFPPSGTFFDIGTTVVTLVGTNIFNEAQSCTFNVIVEEFFPNEFECPANVTISLQNQCSRNIGVAEIINLDSTGCIGNYQIMRLGQGGTPIPPGINAFDVGASFLVALQHIDSAFQCLAQVTVSGGTPPSILCPADITVACNVSLTPEALGTPDTSGCYQNIFVGHFDETTTTSCPDSIGFQINRFWVSTDPFGKKDTCVQTITGRRTGIAGVQFPVDFDGTSAPPLLCDNDLGWEETASPEVTGKPSFLNFPIDNNTGCAVSTNYDDIAVNICGAEYDIQRAWTVVDICNPLMTVKDTQYIKIIDTLPPLFTIPDTLFASLSANCNDSLVLPAANQILECSPFSTEIITPWDTLTSNGGLTIIQVTQGVYPINYTLTDACGNVTDSTSWLVIENETLTSCPPDDSVDCHFYFDVIAPAIGTGDFATLGELGLPSFAGNCSFGITETDSVAIDGCGAGIVFRKMVANDVAQSTCVQRIFVEHVSDFSAIFPADTSICTGPNGLNLGQPIFQDVDCEAVVASFSDAFVSEGTAGCYTLERTWTVTNTCVFNGTNLSDDIPFTGRHYLDGGDGIITYLQKITVNDSAAPVFPEGCDMADLFMPADSCRLVFDVPVPVVEGCRNVELSMSGSLGSEMGASVNLGLGAYQVTYTAVDDCGNMGTCVAEFEVLDTVAPVAVCKPVVAVELMTPVNPGDEPMAEVWVADLDGGSFDNCENDLQFSYSPDTMELRRVFFCCETGSYFVSLWATDQSGNKSSCSSIITVQENMSTCDCSDPVLAGTITTEDSTEINNVTTNISSPFGFEENTTTNGGFTANVPVGGDYTITPSKNTGHLDGVSTFDAVLMTRHILGVSLLDSPYKIIAADINHSGQVTTFDIVEMRKLILNIYTEFPNNTSWRFVPKSYVFPNPLDPWEEPFPEMIFINNVVEDRLDLDFIGIKIGDLNGSN